MDSKFFDRDEFRKMIEETYTDQAEFGNHKVYMNCVDDLQMVARFRAFLGEDSDNILTPT